ncbi:MAG: hypothetical protein ACRDMH_01105 [Solirubrobacterales bacterium]
MLKALTVVAVLLLAVAAFCYRPATILGVDGDALSHSVGSGDLNGCKDGGDGRWECSMPANGGSSAVDYAVKTRSFGCWDATRVERASSRRFPKQLSGCINLIDVVSPF